MVSDHGLTTVPSAYSVRETIDRLERIVTSKGLLVFARIDHAAGAAQVGMPLRPTELLLFGHPQGGTPLMQDQQTAGIDLPVKALAWEDADGHVWLTYNETPWLAQRHQLGDHSRVALEALEAGMVAVIRAATAPSPPETVEEQATKGT